MWIFDSYYKGFVELWSRGRGLERINAAYPPSFYMHLKDSHAHWEMIEGLENRYRVEDCRFNTIFGSFQGQRIFASRKEAEKIEKQTLSFSRLKLEVLHGNPHKFKILNSIKIPGIWPLRTRDLPQCQVLLP